MGLHQFHYSRFWLIRFMLRKLNATSCPFN
jgi:hypothetical protein